MLTDDQRELAEYIVERLADLLDERSESKPEPEFVDAAELARRLGVSRDVVYASADSLGAIRVGAKDSKRPRVVFNVQRSLEAHEHTNGNGPTPRPSRGWRPRAEHHAPLLEIRGAK
jgi:hypothetical protein